MKNLNFITGILILSMMFISCSKKKETTGSNSNTVCTAVGCYNANNPNGTINQTAIRTIEELEQTMEAKRQAEEGSFQAGNYEAIVYDTGLDANGGLAYRRYTVSGNSVSWVDHARSWKLKNLLPRIDLDLPGLVEWSSHKDNDHLGPVLVGSQGNYNYSERIGAVIAKAKTSGNVQLSASTLQVADANGQPVQVRVTYLVDYNEKVAFGFSPDIPIWANPIYVEIGNFNPRRKFIQALKQLQ